MLIEVSTTALKRVLDNVLKVAPKRTSLPIIREVCFKVGEGDSLQLISTDLETVIIGELRARYQGKETQCFVIKDVAKLHKALKYFSDSTIEFNVGNTTINIKNNNKVLDLKLLDSDMYPKLNNISELESLNGYSYSADKLNRRIKLIGYATSKSGSKPEWAGIHFNDSDMVAINNYQGALNKDKGLIVRSPFTVPLKALNKLDVYKGEDIKIAECKHHILFTGKTYTVLTRKFDASYVDYKSLFENNAMYSAKPNRIQMLEGLKYLKAMHEDSYASVVKFSGTQVKLSRYDVSFTLDDIEAYNGQIEVGCEQLIDALKQFDTDAIINITEANIIIEDSDGRNKAVVMPLLSR